MLEVFQTIEGYSFKNIVPLYKCFFSINLVPLHFKHKNKNYALFAFDIVQILNHFIFECSQTLISMLPGLKHLDHSPVFWTEQIYANAWYAYTSLMC